MARKKRDNQAAPETDPAALLNALEQARRDEIDREVRRRELMAQIAKYRWRIAKKHHKLETGEALDFDKYPYQIDIYQDDALEMVVYGSVQWGKALPDDAKVHTPEGWKPNGELKVGDLVSTPFGSTTKVAGVYPQGAIPIYRITFQDGRTAEACGHHRWEIWRSKHGWKPSRGDYWIRQATPEILTTEQIRQQIEAAKDRLSIILPQPVEKPEQPLPIDPYLLGLWLGDGEMSASNPRFTNADMELVAAFDCSLPLDCELYRYQSDSKYTYRVRRVAGVRSGRGPGLEIKSQLRSLGLLDTDCFSKFIPEPYKQGSIEQRWSILQGLMDTDGYASKSISFSSSSERLAKDVQELVWSLGGIATISLKEPSYSYKGERRRGAISYKVNIRHPNPKMLFRLRRKVDRVTDEYQSADTLRLAIRSIEYVGQKPARCIHVEHPRHLYVTDNYVVTHNSEFLVASSAAMAGCGLRVFYVISKYDKRDKFVASRITPAFREIPLYAGLLKAAKDRNAEADSARFKHFGPGSINFVGSNSDKDFTTYACDAAIVDEHQECVLDNLSRLDSRMSGSPWAFRIIAGNPRSIGTEENSNLDWQYQISDRREWHIPCPHCGLMQGLGWWSHFIKEEKNKHGAILSIAPRDEEYRPGFILDMRPVCLECSRPMNRLSREGKWIAQNPGVLRHGYRLSNLYNVNVRMDKLLELYRTALHTPNKMATFVNDQLGMPWNMEGASITEKMLESASRGDAASVAPYRFVHAADLAWETAT